MKTWEQVCNDIKNSSEEAKLTLEIIEVQSDIVAAIINKRFQLGYTQRDLAKMCKLPQSTIARIESFKVNPKIDTLLLIMFSLGLSLSVVS